MDNYNKNIIADYVAESSSIAEVLKKLELDPQGSNYKIIHKIIDDFQLDTSHFLGQSHCKGKQGKSRPLNEVLIENSDYHLGISAKKRLIREGLLIESCYICGIDSWRGQKLSLQIDHINGINNDNRIDNLRFLCPNCHSLTETFCGKNIQVNTEKEKRKVLQDKCVCGKLKGIYNKLCISCYKQFKSENLTKIKWPDIQDLIKMTEELGYLQTGKKLGVSGNAVKKRIKTRNKISAPSGN